MNLKRLLKDLAFTLRGGDIFHVMTLSNRQMKLSLEGGLLENALLRVLRTLNPSPLYVLSIWWRCKSLQVLPLKKPLVKLTDE